MIRKVTTLILIAMLSMISNAQEKFEITRENKTSEHELGLNKYSFVHHVCPDSFFMTELYHNLDYDEMATIVKDVYEGVTFKENVLVTHKDVKPAAAKLLYYVQDSPKAGNIFIMFTNFSNSTRQFEEKPDPKDQLARWYYLKDDRLVYRKDVFSAETEKLKLESDRKSDIIKYYLFDDNAENDDKIKPLIDEILNAEDEGPDYYFAKIYQIQHYLMNNEVEKAGKALELLETYFALNMEIPRNQKIYLLMLKAEYEVMKRL
ncbi:hypothetical protein [Winogradskyella sp. R77965]|uniref:hypothetical protein n=1 Tax=Winogradskyella sp. R77965 TaxID=3093872 RepID=UPI0037DC5353